MNNKLVYVKEISSLIRFVCKGLLCSYTLQAQATFFPFIKGFIYFKRLPFSLQYINPPNIFTIQVKKRLFQELIGY